MEVAFWLNQSNGEVCLALTIDIKKSNKNIYITSWQQGMPTKHIPYLDPKEVQEVKVCPTKGGQQAAADEDDLIIPSN